MPGAKGQTKAVRARIHGKVQGVFYRAWTRDTANSLGLSGWVRNRSDGTVEAVFSGPDDKVRQMLEACNEGPPAARVDRVDTEPADAPEGRGFQVCDTR